MNSPQIFKPTINTVYPYHNHYEFERWFGDFFVSANTDREYIDVYWCAYQVNNNYGQDLEAMKRLQDYIDSLPIDQKYFTISQYDDSVGVDWKGKDVLVFNMSKKDGIQIPLLSQPFPYTFSENKKWLANFIGSRTHPIRDYAKTLKDNDDYYISFAPHTAEQFASILHRSIFTLCFRGYGVNSFRIREAMQYGSIPVYISDEFIIPFNRDFQRYGVIIEEKDCNRIDEILQSISAQEILEKQNRLLSVYNDIYTYDGAFKNIIKELETEYNRRK